MTLSHAVVSTIGPILARSSGTLCKAALCVLKDHCVTKRPSGQRSPMDKVIEDEERAFLYDPTT